MCEDIIRKIETVAKGSAGKTLILKYLRGKKLTRKEAMIAKCCDCMGYYADGLFDCGIEECPMYAYMPYRGRVSKSCSQS